MSRKIKSILFHLLGWVLLLCIPLLLAPDAVNFLSGNPPPPPPPHHSRNIHSHDLNHPLPYLDKNEYSPFKLPPKHLNRKDQISFSPFIIAFFGCLIIFFYLNYYYLIPQYFAKKKWPQYFAIVFFVFCLGIAFSSISTPHFIPPGNKYSLMSFHSFSALVLMITTWGVSSGLRLGGDWIVSDKRRQELELINTQTELSFLKAQINPHFLFNTLNDIYALSLKKSDVTPSVVLGLSKMMRYVLEESQNYYVPLEKELDYIFQYIELQRISHTENVKIDYKVEGDFTNKEIAPLILLPAIENAFKYGSTTQKEVKIAINIVIENNSIVLNIENDLVFSGSRILESTGIGLKNLERRLSILYPRKHLLISESNEDKFITKLQIEF